MTEYAVFDADAHFFEPVPVIGEYLDEPWRSRLTDQDSWGLFPKSTGDRFMGGRIKREEISYPEAPMTPEEIPSVMEFLGIDTIVLLPNIMLAMGGMSGRQRQVNLASGYIDMMLDQVVDPSEGIYALIVVPYHDVDASVQLIDRVKNEPGVVGVCMITAGPEPPLGDPQYDPIYSIAEQAGLPVVFHAGGSSLDNFHVRGFEKFLETHTLGFLWDNMSQLVSLMVQGVPEKFPDMDIIFQESGLFWIPMMMHRLDTEYLKRRSEAPLLNKRPSKYIQEFYFGTQPLEQPEDPALLKNVIDMIGGPDRLLYASDYPHWDFDPPTVITRLPFLTREEKQGILSENAKRVFSL